jgi:hypothetical protein
MPYLKLFMWRFGPSEDLTRHLNDVNVSSREPRTLELSQKGPFDNQSTNSSGVPEHFVKRDGHSVDWMLRDVDYGCGSQRSSINHGKIPQAGRILSYRKGQFGICNVRLRC